MSEAFSFLIAISMTPNSRLIEQALRAAVAGGVEIMKVYDDPDFPTQVAYKSDQSPVTAADKQAHQVIAAALAMPTEEGGEVYPLMSEEGAQVPYPQRAAIPTYWLVDPLDGTKEFLKRNGEFTVNIALIDQGEPVLGVVYVPVTRTLYYAARGLGAFKTTWKGDSDSSDRPQALPMAALLTGRPYTVMTSRSHLSPETANHIEQVRQMHPDVTTVQSGSSLKICLVAEGLADEYPRLGPTMEWDTAAAHAVLKEAGGDMWDYTSMTPLHYNKEDLHNPWFIARLH